jgi:hypothetical protein
MLNNEFSILHEVHCTTVSCKITRLQLVSTKVQTLETLLHKITKLLSNDVYVHQSHIQHTVQYVPHVTYCGTQPSSICKWLSDAKYENLYINHMHLNVSHINLLFPPLQQVLNSAHNHSEPRPILVFVLRPLRRQTAQKKNQSQPQGVGSFSSRCMKVVTT